MVLLARNVNVRRHSASSFHGDILFSNLFGEIKRMRKQCVPGLPPAMEGLGTRLQSYQTNSGGELALGNLRPRLPVPDLSHSLSPKHARQIWDGNPMYMYEAKTCG